MGTVWPALWLLLSSCGWGEPASCELVRDGSPSTGQFTGADTKRTQVPITLVPVLQKCGDVVDIQFVPGSDDQLVVIDQSGTGWFVDRAAGTSKAWIDQEVATGWERGLLGLAFHPKFAENGRVFLNWTARGDAGLVSRVGSFKADPANPFSAAPTYEHLVYEVGQPFSNHNAGGLVFGPDGLLYIGWGDGGKAGDPHNNGQNPKTALGAMLRIDIDGKPPFQVPPDNPYADGKSGLPEVWAIGLRNPWRYSFDAKGRLIAADVGQNKWEEVTYVVAAGNHGWNAREGRHCYASSPCSADGMVEPFWEYGRSEGQSITGGFVASKPASLAGKYLFGDFGSGRLWAVDPPELGQPASEVVALGKFDLKLSTFGRDASGQVYAAGWTDGTVYRIDAAD